MAALLEKLGVPRNVRLFFEPYYTLCRDGSLRFSFGEDFEHFGNHYHRVPLGGGSWIAGEGPKTMLSFSAMEAIAFLTLQAHRFPDLRALRFMALGCQISDVKITSGTPIGLIFGNDNLGRLADIAAAARLRGWPCPVRFDHPNFLFAAASREFEIRPELLSLRAFELKAGLRSGLRTYKPPKYYNSFLQQLLNSHENDPLPAR